MSNSKKKIKYRSSFEKTMVQLAMAWYETIRFSCWYWQSWSGTASAYCIPICIVAVFVVEERSHMPDIDTPDIYSLPRTRHAISSQDCRPDRLPSLHSLTRTYQRDKSWAHQGNLERLQTMMNPPKGCCTLKWKTMTLQLTIKTLKLITLHWNQHTFNNLTFIKNQEWRSIFIFLHCCMLVILVSSSCFSNAFLKVSYSVFNLLKLLQLNPPLNTWSWSGTSWNKKSQRMQMGTQL